MIMVFHSYRGFYIQFLFLYEQDHHQNSTIKRE